MSPVGTTKPRGRSSSPGESQPDYERSRSADRGRGAEQEVFLSASPSEAVVKVQPARPWPKLLMNRMTDEEVIDDATLPVVVGLVCGRLAQEWTCEVLRQELEPHWPASSATQLQEFLDWLKGQTVRSKSPSRPRPRDPRPRGFKEGDTVRLVNLERRPELNDRKVEVLRSCDPSQPGRIIVRHAGSQLAIRPENLQHLVIFPDEMPEKPVAPEAPKESKSTVFGAAFEKLKAKAEAEARGELPAERKKPREKEDLDQRGGIGSSQPAGRARRDRVMGTQSKELDEELEPRKGESITFVAAEAWHEPPSRKVTVIDPRRPKRTMEESDDEDVGIPGVVRPRPGTKDNFAPGPPGSPKATPETVCSMPAAPPRGLAKTVASPPNKMLASPARRPNALQNMTLVVSEDAKEADRAQRQLVEKRKAMEETKRQMLEKLTKQMQTCLARLQNTDLDDKAKERYQDMITSLKQQMSKIGNV